MPRPALSQHQVDAFRERTVQVATKLFASRGFDAVSMRAIAAEMGGSPMTAYRYFRNKGEIFAAVRAEAYRKFADSQREAFEQQQHPMARLAAMHEAYLDFALSDPTAYRIMFQLDQPQQDLADLQEQSGRAFGYLCQAVREAVDAGFLQGEPLTVAHQLWAQVHGLVTLHLAGKLAQGRTLAALRSAPMPVFTAPLEITEVRKRPKKAPTRGKKPA